jgi:hypothetical protein
VAGVARRLRSAGTLVIVAAIVAACGLVPFDGGATGSPWADVTPLETRPLVVGLCHGANQSWPERYPASYFEAQFTETDGSSTIADFWRDVSSGRFSVEGSLVLEVQLDVDNEAIAHRSEDWELCREGLDEQYDIDWDAYGGLAVFKPQAEGALVDAIDVDDALLRVRAGEHTVAADWPEPPFLLAVTRSNSTWRKLDDQVEYVRVTGAAPEDAEIVTFTVERAVSRGERDTKVKSFDAGTTVLQFSDLYGSSGRVVSQMLAAPSLVTHELGHLLGLSHTRKLSTSTRPYNDCFDVMSTVSCAPSHHFSQSLAYAGPDIEAMHGMAMTTAHLDRMGWLGEDERRSFTCGDRATYTLRALGLAGGGARQVWLPATVDIREGVVSTHLTVEHRSQEFPWDRGIPRDAVVLHLVGDDGIVYLLDDQTAGGVLGMIVGDEYALGADTDDVLDDVTIAVDAIDGLGSAEVTFTRPVEAGLDCGAGGAAGSASPPDVPWAELDPRNEYHDPVTAPPPETVAPDAARECLETPDGHRYPFPLPAGATYVGVRDLGFAHRYRVPSYDAALLHLQESIEADTDHSLIDTPGISRIGDLRDEGFTLVGRCYDLAGGFSLLEQEDGSVTLDVLDLG